MSDAETDDTEGGTSNPEPSTRARAAAIRPGAVVGRHVVLHRLGKGGMGVVYAAYDPQLDRKIALKLLLPGARGDIGGVRLLREAQALARLSHPNVVGIHDVGTMGEQVWLAMEFLQGRTLGAWLEQRRGWQEVLAVLRKAGEGLAAAHAAGLLHRDFKPDNVMVGDDGRVCVMDFGLARVHGSAGPRDSDTSQRGAEPSVEPGVALANSVTRAGVIVGTPRYMAPEQFGNEELTAAADQFAFCLTLWQALYGERPFAGETPGEIAANILAGRLRPPARARAVPGWLRQACTRGLAVEPTARWPSMSAMLEVLATGRTRARVRTGALVLGALVLLGVGVEARRRLEQAQQVAACEATAGEVAEAWSAEREQALRAGLVATGVSYAAANSLVDLADVALAQQRPDDALPLVERAVALREARAAEAGSLASARFVLAQALWDAPAAMGRDRAKARRVAEQARDACRTLGKSRAKTLARVEAWLAAHPLE